MLFDHPIQQTEIVNRIINYLTFYKHANKNNIHAKVVIIIRNITIYLLKHKFQTLVLSSVLH